MHGRRWIALLAALTALVGTAQAQTVRVDGGSLKSGQGTPPGTPMPIVPVMVGGYSKSDSVSRSFSFDTDNVARMTEVYPNAFQLNMVTILYSGPIAANSSGPLVPVSSYTTASIDAYKWARVTVTANALADSTVRPWSVKWLASLDGSTWEPVMSPAIGSNSNFFSGQDTLKIRMRGTVPKGVWVPITAANGFPVTTKYLAAVASNDTSTVNGLMFKVDVLGRQQ